MKYNSYSWCKCVFVTRMPESCKYCQFNADYCTAINDIRKATIPLKGKNDKCPLILVKK